MPRVKFIKVSLMQNVSRAMAMDSSAKELESVFRIPCDVSVMVILSRVIAQQYRLRYTAYLMCCNGEVYATRYIDVGSYAPSCDAALYLLQHGFSIYGRNAVILRNIIRRATSLAIEVHSDGVSILYSL